jgi:uncharacterized membrane protein YqaE (UPF0057 family)
VGLAAQTREMYAPGMSNNNQQISTLLLVIIAILLPPLAVGLKTGVGVPLLLNIILCLLFWIPGLLHALWVVLK